MTWAEDIATVSAEAAGLMQLDLVDFREVPGLVLTALAGDRDAARLLVSINQVLAQVQRAPRRNPALCVCCPRPLRKSRFMCGVASPARDDPAQAIGFGICERCAPDVASAKPKVLVALRRIWPDAQPVDITHPEGGRA